MIIPKNIIIAGKRWVVKKENKERGGWFDGDKCEISIGTKNYTKDEIENIFLHEVIEAILAERLMRYKLPFADNNNGNFLYNFNHIQFENWIRDLRLALQDCLK